MFSVRQTAAMLDWGLSVGDLGLRIADCGLRIGEGAAQVWSQDAGNLGTTVIRYSPFAARYPAGREKSTGRVYNTPVCKT